MPSLIGTTVTANYLKTAPSTQFGTRALKFLVINADGSGDSDVDLTKRAFVTDAFVGAYTDSDSYLTRVVRAVQEVAEVYAVGTPTATDVVVVVADDTANGAEAASNVQATTYGLLEGKIKAALGVGNKAGGATAYNGTVTVTPKDLSGATLA